MSLLHVINCFIHGLYFLSDLSENSVFGLALDQECGLGSFLGYLDKLCIMFLLPDLQGLSGSD